MSSILPDFGQEYAHIQQRNSSLERENLALKKKVEFLMTDGEQLKVEQ